MTYDEVREEIFAFLIGAFDTTGKALAGALLLLAMNQDAQDKVVIEMENIFKSEDDEVDEDALSQMNYLDLVIKESLRLLPVALVIGRQAKKNIELSKKFS